MSSFFNKSTLRIDGGGSVLCHVFFLGHFQLCSNVLFVSFFLDTFLSIHVFIFFSEVLFFFNFQTVVY